MLPSGAVLCTLGQYWVFPPLAAIITAMYRGMFAAICCRCSAEISVHLSSRVWRSSPRFWGGLSMMIARPNSSQICSMGLQAILQTALSWWHCPVEENQGLTEHGEVWHCRFGSGNYPRNNPREMALRCFATCPCRAHRWGRGAQEVIWHHCEKLPRRVLNHHQLGSYKPSTFAGRAHQVNDVP